MNWKLKFNYILTHCLNPRWTQLITDINLFHSLLLLAILLTFFRSSFSFISCKVSFYGDCLHYQLTWFFSISCKNITCNLLFISFQLILLISEHLSISLSNFISDACNLRFNFSIFSSRFATTHEYKCMLIYACVLISYFLPPSIIVPKYWNSQLVLVFCCLMLMTFFFLKISMIFVFSMFIFFCISCCQTSKLTCSASSVSAKTQMSSAKAPLLNLYLSSSKFKIVYYIFIHPFRI